MSYAYSPRASARLFAFLFAGASGLALLTAAEAADPQPATPVTATPPAAQPTPAAGGADAEAADAAEAAQPEAEGAETVVVTGSRLRKTTFNSASPLQVIDGAKARELGFIDTSKILQSVSAANGVQIDTSVSSSFVAVGGPGVSSIDLRNLDPSRTLVLIDDRRMAPAGVEGAPVSPDVGLIPSSLIDRIEVLLDGASSVYGSDAVAGVVNVKLIKKFDGFKVSSTVDYPTTAGGGGRSQNIAGLYGYTGENSNVLVAAEYRNVERLSYGERDFSDKCPNGYNREVDINTGEEHTFDPRWGSDCYAFGALGGYVSVAGLSRFYTPGVTNDPVFALPGFSRTRRIGPNPGDEAVNLLDEQYSRLDWVRDSDLVPGGETFSLFARGDTTLDEATQTQLFFELGYNRRTQHFATTTPQLFLDVPSSNPFNPFGDATFGLDARPVLMLYNDRNRNHVRVWQARFVGGVRGDFFEGSSWHYEATLVYTKSEGQSIRHGYRADLLELSLNTTVETSPGVFECGADVDPSLPACVPVNLFSDSALRLGRLSAAEEAFLYDKREFNTTTKQILFNAYAAGDLFELQGGMAEALIGVEYRKDTLDSIPDDNARFGLIQNTFSDAGATGSARITEGFAEVQLPFLKDAPWAKDLVVNLSGRFTDHQYYGQAWTYGAKALWSPTEWLTLRGTYGTSYRAPNLREFFLGRQTGFISSSIDPCIVPAAAIDPGPVYNPDNDRRSAQAIANCQAEGLDPFTLGLGGTESIESVTGGSRELEDETSKAFSLGFVLDQPFWDDVNLKFGLTYYGIEITNSIERPGVANILDECYEKAPGSPYCARITRFTSGSHVGQIETVDNSFINVGLISTKGIDYNLFYGQDVTVFGQTLGLTLDVSLSQTLENNVTTFGVLEEAKGGFGTPEWRGTIDMGAEMGEWSVLWRARYIGHMADLANANPAFDTCPLINPPPSTARDPACTSGANRLEKTFAESQWLHSMAVTYAPGEDWSVTLGVDNIFDQDPEFLDPDVSGAVATTDNTGALRGVGYDFLGRRVYMRVSASF